MKPIISTPSATEFQAVLPLPLARLYARAHHAKGERERHDYALHLVEASLKLAAAALVARYRVIDKRSDEVDAVLGHFALPSLGHWHRIFRDTLLYLGGGEVDDPWVHRIREQLSVKSESRTGTFRTLAKAASWAGRASARVSVMDILELIPTYRNAMSDAHGSIKADPAIYREATPALLEVAGLLAENRTLTGGGALLFSEEVKRDVGGKERVVWMELGALGALRRQPYEGVVTEEPILPGRLYVEIGPQEHLSLHPLVHYQPGEVVDRVFFLNRARKGKSGVQFLCYSTGDFYLPGRDAKGDFLVRDLEELLSWVTQKSVDAEERISSGSVKLTSIPEASA